MTRSDRALMSVYYVGTGVVGAFTAIGDPAPTLVGALGRGPSLIGLATLYVVAAVSGLIARWKGRRTVEATALTLMAAATLIHGAALLWDDAYTTGVRLIVAPALMLSYAIRLRHQTITAAVLDQAASLVQNEKE